MITEIRGREGELIVMSPLNLTQFLADGNFVKGGVLQRAVAFLIQFPPSRTNEIVWKGIGTLSKGPTPRIRLAGRKAANVGAVTCRALIEMTADRRGRVLNHLQLPRRIFYGNFP